VSAPETGCPLCGTDDPAAVHLLWRGARCRVVRVLDTPAHPGCYRVIWGAHAAEFTDLPATDRAHAMDVVAAVEQALREALSPAKINLASLGNVVPHLHWHVIARFADDAHFPQPVWAAPLRDGTARAHAVRAALPAADRRVLDRLSDFA
jgi:diadenosine tetraphosphate (Ap4A) HIT family hydrolase